MASIFNGNCIREHKALPYIGRPLVFGIGTKDPKEHTQALEAHDFIFLDKLNDPQRRQLTPKWMGKAVKALLRHPRRAWGHVLDPYLSELGETRKEPTGPSIAGSAEPIAQPVQVPLADVVAQYNRLRGHHHFGPYFPGQSEWPDLVSVVIDHVLAHGTVHLPQAKRTPLPEWAALVQNVKMEKAPDLRDKVASIQELHRYGEGWKRFHSMQGLQYIGQLEEENATGYMAWRKTPKGKPISKYLMQQELGYFRAVCRYAVKKRFLPFNPMEEVKLSKMAHRQATDSHQNYPLPLESALALLAGFKVHTETINEGQTGQQHWTQAVKLNYFTLVFLMVTGCRPKEVSQWSIVGEFLQFHKRSTLGSIGGKTKKANRRIPLSPTLATIVQDGIMRLNEGSNVSERMHQAIERLGFTKSNPYRIRHTVCSLLFAIGDLTPTEIAYRMGHSDPGFSYSVYGDMGPYLGAKVHRDTLRAFWAWLNDGILNPSMPWFELLPPV